MLTHKSVTAVLAFQQHAQADRALFFVVLSGEPRPLWGSKRGGSGGGDEVVIIPSIMPLLVTCRCPPRPRTPLPLYLVLVCVCGAFRRDGLGAVFATQPLKKQKPLKKLFEGFAF